MLPAEIYYNPLYAPNILIAYNIRFFPVGKQLDAQVFSMIHLFKFSTCFEQLCAHLQEDNFMNTTSGTITLR
jgi:hypothetical protein